MKDAIRQLEPSTHLLLRNQFKRLQRHSAANEWLCSLCGVEGFFSSQDQFMLCKELLKHTTRVGETSDRREYGDFQTPPALAEQVCQHLARNSISADCLLEPTFGRGVFLTTAIRHFPNLKWLYGIEIYEPYVWSTKFALLEQALEHPREEWPTVRLFHADVFSFDFKQITELDASRFLVLGNPPWVTNSELGLLSSDNLPRKRNFKKLNGLDAITGRSNFDISEYMTLMLLEVLATREGSIALLLKNKVIQNVAYYLPHTRYQVSDLRILPIDARTHFDAAVEASLFTCTFGATSRSEASEYVVRDAAGKEFGWTNGKFVSDVEAYQHVSRYDGQFPLTWRQGIKHDCAKIMELSIHNGSLVNALGEELDLEDGPIYGLVKSSDLRKPLIRSTHKRVIVPQQTIGEDTQARLQRHPRLLAYLLKHKELFDRRKSSVYQGKPPFSIFGVGEYSFASYKVAVSGFYKDPCFSLVLPVHGKPVMADDTCYFLSFDELPQAIYTWAALSNRRVKQLLQAIAFNDSKRPLTKQLLMRIDLVQLVKDIEYREISLFVTGVDGGLAHHLSLEAWLTYTRNLSQPSSQPEQLQLF
jgi:hypothetical protein